MDVSYRYGLNVNKENGMDRPTLTITEAAKLLGIGRSAAYEAARRGDLPTLSFGRRRVVLSAALEQMLRFQRGSLSGEIYRGQVDDA
jgi:excisionase family DNA binding protein